MTGYIARLLRKSAPLVDDYSFDHVFNYISLIAGCQEADARYNYFAINPRRRRRAHSGVDKGGTRHWALLVPPSDH
jgi:hypothetical protein